MDKILISIEDICRYRPTSKVIPVDRIQPFIRESQMQDLMPVLGDVLYYDFLNKFDVTTDPKYTEYQELLYGKTYTPSGYPSTITFEGVVPIVAYFALARYYENSQLNATAYGLVQKNSEYATATPSQAVQAHAEYLRSLGVSFQDGLKVFLNNNLTTYPLYQYGDKGNIQDMGVKFFSV